MTAPINTVEVETPKPKLPRRWVWVDDVPDSDGDYGALARADQDYCDGGAKDTLYALPASDDVSPPTVCAIPDEFLNWKGDNNPNLSRDTLVLRISKLVEWMQTHPLPTACAIPTRDEWAEMLWRTATNHTGNFDRVDVQTSAYFGRLADASLALVASRVVVNSVTQAPGGFGVLTEVEVREFRAQHGFDASPPDPIRAIVEILDLMQQGCGSQARHALAELKASMEKPA